MPLKIGLENGVEGRSLAWGLEQLGLFAYGQSGAEALENLPAALQGYRTWIASHDAQLKPGLMGVEFELVETFLVYVIDEQFDLAQDGYEVNTWFLHDWKPLLPEEIEHIRVMAARETVASKDDLKINSMDLIITSFDLLLLPLWFAQFQHRGDLYRAYINGQNGTLLGEKPGKQEADGWLSRMLEGG